MPAEPIPLSELERDLPEPADGWAESLARRGVAIVQDDIGRPAVGRSVARQLLAEHRDSEARNARLRVEIEQRALEADQRFRAALPRGIPVNEIPAGMTGAELLMAADPMDRGKRRVSVVEHALGHRDDTMVFHSLRDEAS